MYLWSVETEGGLRDVGWERFGGGDAAPVVFVGSTLT